MIEDHNSNRKSFAQVLAYKTGRGDNVGARTGGNPQY